MTDLVQPAEDGAATRWLSIAAAIASISVVGIALGLGVPLLSVVLEGHGYSASMIGLNTAVAGLASIAAAPLATPLAVRAGVARTMLAMIAIGAFSLLGFHFATSFWMWFPLRVVLHAAITILFILSEFWISVSAPPRRRGLVLGIYATVLSLGFALGPWLLAQTGSDGLLPFGAAFALVMAAAVPVLAAWRESPALAAAQGRPGGFARFIWLVPAATGAVVVFGAVETGGYSLFPIYAGALGYSQHDAALLLSMIGLGNVILQIPLGMISDRVRDRRVLLLFCALTGLAGTLLMPWAGTWHLMAVLLFVWGGVVAALYTIGLAHLASRLSGSDLASANAAFVLCYGVGMVLGPQAIGIGMDVLGEHGFGWTLAMFFAAYLMLVAGRMRIRPPASGNR